jgi:hypothetical protein
MPRHNSDTIHQLKIHQQGKRTKNSMRALLWCAVLSSYIKNPVDDFWGTFDRVKLKPYKFWPKLAGRLTGNKPTVDTLVDISPMVARRMADYWDVESGRDNFSSTFVWGEVESTNPLSKTKMSELYWLCDAVEDYGVELVVELLDLRDNKTRRISPYEFSEYIHT